MHACTHVCYLGGFISALACGIFPHDERTMSEAEDENCAKKKIYGEVGENAFPRGETTRGGGSE